MQNRMSYNVQDVQRDLQRLETFASTFSVNLPVVSEYKKTKTSSEPSPLYRLKKTPPIKILKNQQKWHAIAHSTAQLDSLPGKMLRSSASMVELGTVPRTPIRTALQNGASKKELDLLLRSSFERRSLAPRRRSIKLSESKNLPKVEKPKKMEIVEHDEERVFDVVSTAENRRVQLIVKKKRELEPIVLFTGKMEGWDDGDSLERTKR